MPVNDASEQPRPPALAGVLLPGSGRLRLCQLHQTLVSDLAQGDWVAIESAYGVEGGQVLAPPEQLLGSPSTESYGRIIRQLEEIEIERVAELAEEVRSLLTRLTPSSISRPAELLITGLRFTIEPKQAIVSWWGDTDPPDDWLRQNLDLPYTLEHEDASTSSVRLYGGLGRLRPAAANLEAIIRRRFESAGSTDMPGGFPRLLSLVATPQGNGSVVSVSTKHHRARVKLAGGNEVLVPLDELQVLDWNR